MEQIKLRGSYEEIGVQQGLALKAAGVKLSKPDPRRLRFALAGEALLAEHAPELLQEMHGISVAAGIDYVRLMTATVTAPFDPKQLPAAACSVVAVLPERSGDGHTLVGRNCDFFFDVSAKGATTCWTYPEGRYASLGNCDIWVGREDGFNQAGLFVG